MPVIAIIGASGLIGHMLYRQLSQRFDRVVPLLHGRVEDAPTSVPFVEGGAVGEVDVDDFDQLVGVLRGIRADVVLNCAGITKRRAEIHDPVRAIAINALFPHRLASWAAPRGVRVIHFSTDCVFDGASGPYTEESPPTAKDAYGTTKALGEIKAPGSLTIRSSFIGRELAHHTELLDWFLQQAGRIHGFANVYYSGISTIEMARIVGDMLVEHPDLTGLYQLAMPTPISKYDLLTLARRAFDRDVEIIPDHDVFSMPTLDGSRLAAVVDLGLPSWTEMMEELAADRSYPDLPG